MHTSSHQKRHICVEPPQRFVIRVSVVAVVMAMSESGENNVGQKLQKLMTRKLLSTLRCFSFFLFFVSFHFCSHFVVVLHISKNKTCFKKKKSTRQVVAVFITYELDPYAKYIILSAYRILIGFLVFYVSWEDGLFFCYSLTLRNNDSTYSPSIWNLCEFY